MYTPQAQTDFHCHRRQRETHIPGELSRRTKQEIGRSGVAYVDALARTLKRIDGWAHGNIFSPGSPWPNEIRQEGNALDEPFHA